MIANSLPYRQLRKFNTNVIEEHVYSLPYRQLRKIMSWLFFAKIYSLPYRQLRNATFSVT